MLKNTGYHLALNLSPRREVRRSTKQRQRGRVDRVALGEWRLSASPPTAAAPGYRPYPLSHDGQDAGQAARSAAHVMFGGFFRPSFAGPVGFIVLKRKNRGIIKEKLTFNNLTKKLKSLNQVEWKNKKTFQKSSLMIRAWSSSIRGRGVNIVHTVMPGFFSYLTVPSNF